ncbi:hypothetical protein VLL09_04840 [Dehalococcoides mccartyi]|uniref:Uncharacterized protein n=1 Tax=Dehalococcoides mccartyi TaxID=61435 RepID=A0AB38Z803_9CHLR|nr:hypothetical protein [Dehalococcoides mccartyi]WRO06719.1 hypothetical protein VLL09_04840 [Dehalococcoides mccartyi]
MSLLIKASGKAALPFIIDGGGAAIETGEKGHLSVPFGCLIDRVTMLADMEGSIRVDIWKSRLDGFPPTAEESITGGNPPRIDLGNSYEDSGLEHWGKALSEGDILAFNVDSVGGGGVMGLRDGGGSITRVTISLHVRKT